MTSDDGRNLARLSRLVPRRQTARLAALTALTALGEGVGFALVVPLLAVAAGRTASSGPLAMLADWPLSLLLAGFVAGIAVRVLAEGARALAAHDFAARIVDTLRGRALDALLHAEWRVLSGEDQPRNQAVLLVDIERVGYAGDLFAQGLRCLLLLAGLMLAGLLASPGALLVLAALALPVGAVHARFARRAAQAGETVTDAYETLALQLQETLDNVRLVKTTGNETSARDAVAGTVARLRRAERAYVRAGAMARGIVAMLAAGVVAAIVWGAAWWTSGEGARAAPDWPVWIALTALGVRAVPLLAAAQQVAQQWAHEMPALLHANRLIERFEGAREPAPAEVSGPAVAGDIDDPHPRPGDRIVLEGVGVERDGRAILDGVCMELARGSIVALEGASGAGKSTLADVVGGLIAPDRGRVLLDGTMLEGGLRTAWRGRVAHVHQQPVLFAGSVRDNLRWAHRQADDARLRDALEAANAGFVHARPGGWTAPLAAGTHQLSGGERQRIALARALIGEPDLLILDEATSAIDAESEAAIMASLSALRERMTILVIAHRGRIADIADRRLTLSNGRLLHSASKQCSGSIKRD